jgi:WD40 repeat protein
MYYVSRLLKIAFAIALSADHSVYSITIGSDTVVNRLGFQVIANGDRVANFAFLEGGFALLSTNVTATLDTFFPTTGLVDLNGGTLYLSKDFVLHNVVQLQTGGNIIGNGNMLDLAQSVTCVPLGIGGCTAVLNTTQATPSAINSVSWSFDSRFVAVATNTTGGAELVIYEFDGSSLTLRASLNRTVSFRCVAWHPSLYLLALGTASDGANAELVMFSFNPNTFSLTITDSEEFSSNVSAVSWHPGGEYLAVGSSANTREIAVYPVSSGGIFGTPVDVNVIPNDNVNINALSWNYDGTLLASGHAANLRIYVFTTTPSLTLNVTLAVAGGVNGVAWNPNFAFRNILAIGTVSNVPRVRIYRHVVSPASLTQLLTSALDATVRGTRWSPDGYCLGVTKNTSLAANEFFIYAFNTNPLTLVNVTSFNSASSLSSLAWTPNGRYVATGAANNVLAIYSTTAQLLANGMFNWSDLYVRLNTNVCINNCTLRFQGRCVIDGRGNTLSLSPTSTLLVDTNAALLLRDIAITGVTDQNIRCADSTSTCSFENVEMILDGNYTLDQGRFDVLESLLVRGASKIFVQRTGQISTIFRNSIFELDNQVTFSYDPFPARRDGLAFEDQSSQLVLNGATFHTTATGISLEKGTIIVKTTGLVEAEGATSGGAITFGNGVSMDCNQTIELYPDAQLHIGSGAVMYSNV